MVSFWRENLLSKFKNDPSWPFYPVVELIDIASNFTLTERILTERLIDNSSSQVTVVVGAEGGLGRAFAYIAAEHKVPYLLAVVTTSASIASVPIGEETAFYIEAPPQYTFKSLIDQYVKVNVKTMATVSYHDEFDGEFNYNSCYGAANSLAVPRGIQHIGSYHVYANSTYNDVKNVALQLKKLNPDAVLWCDWQSCFNENEERFSIQILKDINYLPKAIAVLDCFEFSNFYDYVDKGLMDYVGQPGFTHPDLQGQEYTQDDNPYSNLFRPPGNSSLTGKEIYVAENINIGDIAESPSSVKLFYDWFVKETGNHPQYYSNQYWGVLDIIESALYRAALIHGDTKNEVINTLNRKIVLAMLHSSQISGVYGRVVLDAYHKNTPVSTIFLQSYPGQRASVIVAPSGQATGEFIYPMPTWEERIYTWDLFRNMDVMGVSISVASVCSLVILVVLMTIIVHRNGKLMYDLYKIVRLFNLDIKI